MSVKEEEHNSKTHNHIKNQECTCTKKPNALNLRRASSFGIYSQQKYLLILCHVRSGRDAFTLSSYPQTFSSKPFRDQLVVWSAWLGCISDRQTYTPQYLTNQNHFWLIPENCRCCCRGVSSSSSSCSLSNSSYTHMLQHSHTFKTNRMYTYMFTICA